MQVEHIPLKHAPSGTSRELCVYRFGQPGARPKAYIQAALHADELPGILVAHELRKLLSKAEEAGELIGEAVLVPAANPIGLSQDLLGVHHGRFALADGQNFNRGFADLTKGLKLSLYQISALSDAQNSTETPDQSGLLRRTLRTAAAAGVNRAVSESSALKAQLLALAIDADVVLDLHCDGEAVMHLYTLPSLVARVEPLARLLRADVCLTAQESGEGPFDEACSRPWAVAAAAMPEAKFATACLATTVELRGEHDVLPLLAADDALAIFEFLKIEGVVGGRASRLPSHVCHQLPLAATEPLIAPVSGVIVYEVALGENVGVGDTVAHLIDPISGDGTPVRAGTSGLFFARASSRWASAGKRIGKIAGAEVIRSGKLLSP